MVFSALLNVGAMLAVWAAALATGRVPRWLFDFQLSVLRWHTRTVAYLLLLTGANHRSTASIRSPATSHRPARSPAAR